MNRAKPPAALRTALAAALLLLFFLAGCATLPESEPVPPAELPTLWEAAAAGDIGALDAHRQSRHEPEQPGTRSRRDALDGGRRER